MTTFIRAGALALALTTSAAAQPRTAPGSSDRTPVALPAADPVSRFETYIPNQRARALSPVESRMLIRYLDRPGDVRAALSMAVYHLLGLRFDARSADSGQVRRAIYAEYFLYRARQLGATGAWIDAAIGSVDAYLSSLLATTRGLDMSEGSPAHQAFIHAFTSDEAQRYHAEELLLAELLERPENLLTNAYLAAVNLWNAGESRYSDPGIVYSYVAASYFAQRATELSRRAELEWSAAPQTHTLFRLAPAMGGFTIPARRWLARLHGDTAAVALLDQELSEWFPHNPQFYMFPVGVHAFNEPARVATGFSAFLTGFEACMSDPNVFCSDHPRSTYNVIGFFLYAFDYYMKVGDVASALGMLELEAAPQFRYDAWYLGQEAWEHRENNAQRIATLYQNADPADDPIMGFQKRHAWGPESSTCQLCHQVQGTSWSAAEMAKVESLSVLDRYVGSWPASFVAWDGSIR